MYVPDKEEVLIDVVIERLHADPEFGMIRNDHVRRLSLCDQRPDNLIHVTEFLGGHINSCSCRYKTLCVVPVSRDGIVVVLGLDRASVPGSFAAVADKGSFRDTQTVLLFKARTYAVASQAGLAVDVAYLDLLAGVHLLATEAMNTEVQMSSKI